VGGCGDERVGRFVHVCIYICIFTYVYMYIYNTYIPTHQDFPPHEDEAKYHFVTCSTMKPTQWHYPGGGVNQVSNLC